MNNNEHKPKKQVTMYLDQDNINYFKKESSNVGIPYQTLINMYLSDCTKSKRKIDIDWKIDNKIKK